MFKKGPSAGFSYMFLLIILFSFFIRIPAVAAPHLETDEMIYQTLACQILIAPSHYSLQGTSILKTLPKQMYDRPVFFHPPLFVVCLAFMTFLFGSKWAVMVSVVSGVGTIILTYDICRRLYDDKKALMAAAIAFCCPLLLFCSTRILIDMFLAFLISLTVWSFLIAAQSNTRSYFIYSGIIFGLSLLTKQVGLLILLTCVYILFKEGFSKQKFISFIYFLFTAILICSPWYLYFYKIYHTISPWWAMPSHELIKVYPFIRMMVNRPWHFYFTCWAVIAPVYLLTFFNILYSIKSKRISPEIIWAFSFLIPLTLLGLNGWGFQTRYVVPAIPALAILCANVLDTKDRWVQVLGVLFLCVGFITGILNSLVFRPEEIFPFYVLMRIHA